MQSLPKFTDILCAVIKEDTRKNNRTTPAITSNIEHTQHENLEQKYIGLVTKRRGRAAQELNSGTRQCNSINAHD